jgi:lysophospholipase L1-like esterase
MRRLALRLAAAGAAGALALGGAELACRLRARGFGPTTNPRYAVRDDELGWRYLPGARVRHAERDFDVAIEIDARGLRDAAPAAPDGRPIAALGDSLTFGWGVEEREAFPALLEGLCGVPVENLGVSGYGTDQELLFFRRAGAPLRPRALVVTVCGNDVDEAAHGRRYGRAKPFFPLVGGALGACEPPEREGFLLRHSQLARSLAKAWRAHAERPPSPEELAQGRERVVLLLAELGRLASAAGGGLLVCAAGEPWLGPALEARGIPFLDLGPALAEAGREGPVVFAHDPHWTARGHAAVAAALAERLRALDLLR